MPKKIRLYFSADGSDEPTADNAFDILLAAHDHLASLGFLIQNVDFTGCEEITDREARITLNPIGEMVTTFSGIMLLMSDLINEDRKRLDKEILRFKKPIAEQIKTSLSAAKLLSEIKVAPEIVTAIAEEQGYKDAQLPEFLEFLKTNFKKPDTNKPNKPEKPTDSEKPKKSTKPKESKALEKSTNPKSE
jgi:hypothetical protein